MVNVKQYTAHGYIDVKCSVHKIITQKFSALEMQFILEHAETYPICDSCRETFRKRREELAKGKKRGK